MSNMYSLEPAGEGRRASSTVPYTLRDYASMGFRHRRMIVTVLLAVMLGALIAGLIPRYESEMKVLVTHERIDPVITAQNGQQIVQEKVAEEDVNSEVELLKSSDLLEEVVRATGIHGQSRWSLSKILHRNTSPETRIALAVRALKKSLTIDPVKKTNVIDVKYISTNPQRAGQVMQSLGQSYLSKHLDVHHPKGELEFFEQQVNRCGVQLRETEKQLANFTRDQGVVSGQLERDAALNKLSEFRGNLAETQALIDEANERIAVLEQQQASAPQRLMTQKRELDNPQLLQQLESTLLSLELQRTELLTKYAPTYRLVQEVDAKLAQTRAAIDSAEHTPLRDQTTDRDPTFEWIHSSLVKSQSELKALRVRKASLTRMIADFERASARFNEKSIAQQELMRTAKAQEQTYLLYLQKREEARITSALDDRRILNVAIIEAPRVPRLPSNSLPMYLLSGLLLGTIGSLALVFVAELFDSSVHTSRELAAALEDVPVLATIPVVGYRRSRLPAEGRS